MPFTGVIGEADFDLDLQIARELQLQDWQEEEKKKKAPEDEEAEKAPENEEAKNSAKEEGEEESKEVENIEGVDMDALRKFIAKEVESFFAQKLSEILNPAAWAANEE